jgi:hypothetical protein
MEETPMLIRTSIALAAAAFLGFTAVSEAGSNRGDSKFRQVEGFSFHYGPLGQYFGTTPPRLGYYYYGYDYGPYRNVNRYRRWPGYPYQ